MTDTPDLSPARLREIVNSLPHGILTPELDEVADVLGAIADRDEAAAAPAGLRAAIGQARSDDVVLEYVLIRGFHALGFALPSQAAADMLDAATIAATQEDRT